MKSVTRDEKPEMDDKNYHYLCFSSIGSSSDRCCVCCVLEKEEKTLKKNEYYGCEDEYYNEFR